MAAATALSRTNSTLSTVIDATEDSNEKMLEKSCTSVSGCTGAHSVQEHIHCHQCQAVVTTTPNSTLSPSQTPLGPALCVPCRLHTVQSCIADFQCELAKLNAALGIQVSATASAVTLPLPEKETPEPVMKRKILFALPCGPNSNNFFVYESPRRELNLAVPWGKDANCWFWYHSKKREIQMALPFWDEDSNVFWLHKKFDAE